MSKNKYRTFDYPESLLEERLDGIEEVYLLGLSAVCILNDTETHSSFLDKKVVFTHKDNFVEISSAEDRENLYIHSLNESEILLSGTLNKLKDHQHKKLRLQQFMDNQINIFLQHCLGIVEEYTWNNTRVQKDIDGSDVILFLRIMRNAFAHKCLLSYSSDNQRKRLPVKWRGRELCSDMEGITIHADIFNFHDALFLVRDVRKYMISLGS